MVYPVLGGDEMPPILSVKALSYSYPDGTKALDKLTFCVNKGEKIAVLGANGSGKSTLFLCLNGVVRAKQGEICLSGKPYAYDKKSLIKIRSKVGIVFQDPETQLFCSDVYQEVAFGPANLKLPVDILKDRVEQSMQQLDVQDYRHRPAHLLSYGQKKRVSIAAVLSMQPELILFDEPAASLDPVHTKQLQDILDTLTGQGLTMLMATHDVDTAFAWADRVLVLVEGKVAALDLPELVFDDLALLKQANLTEPAVLRLYRALLKTGREKAQQIPRTVAELEAYIAQ